MATQLLLGGSIHTPANPDATAMAVTDDTVVWVGYDDPTLQSTPTSARSQQSLATMGTRNRDEAGEVSCAVFVENGDGDMDAALAEAEGMVDELGHWLVNATFQDLPQFTTVLFGDSTQWLMDRTEFGAAVLVQFSVAFKARIYP